MKWVKAAVVGILGALVMFIFIAFAIQRDIAPFNIPPSAAMLTKLGINVGPLPLLVHLGDGAFWSMVLVFLLREHTNVWNSMGLGVALWLNMMIIYSPVLGWGFFGFGGSGSTLAPDHPLYLAPGPKYLIATLVLHVIYGAIIGWLNPLWIQFRTVPGK
ncbi:MAG: hypothetical protein ACE5MK_07885 [Acidobacteriota bacterium]